MKKTVIPKNFIYPDIPENVFVFGSNQIKGVPLRPDGDWRNFLPSEELQTRNNVESSSCYVHANQHAISTLLEEQYGIPDSDFSERFNALLSNGTPNGGDPLACGQSIRHDGLIADSLMPFSQDIVTWPLFHSWFDTSEANCRTEGKNWLSKWQPNYDIVFKMNDDVKVKYSQLREALKYSPIAVSVYGWVEENGLYIKPAGTQDNHLVECVYLDDQNRMYIRDTYSPFLKILEPFYNSSFAMRWAITKLELTEKKSLLLQLLDAITKLLKLFSIQDQEKNTPPVIVPVVKRTVNDLANAIAIYENVRPELNNPGGLRSSPFANGYIIQSTTGKQLATFATREEGMNALIYQITIVCKGTSPVYQSIARSLGLSSCSQMTLEQFLHAYAPRYENDTEKYLAFIEQKSGIQRSAIMSSLLS